MANLKSTRESRTTASIKFVEQLREIHKEIWYLAQSCELTASQVTAFDNAINSLYAQQSMIFDLIDIAIENNQREAALNAAAVAKNE